MRKYSNSTTMENDRHISEDVGFSSHIVLDNTINEHNHTFYEVIYVIDGQIKHTLDGVESILNIGDMVIISPNNTHSLSYVRSSSNRDIMISTSLYDGVAKLIPQIDKLIKDNGGTYTLHYSIPELLELEDTVNDILNDTNVTLKRIKSVSFLVNLFNKIHLNSQNILVIDKVPQDAPSFIRKIVSNINKTSFMQSNIATLVKDTGYAHPYVCRIFKKYMGISISDYLQKIRVSHVAYYLKTTDYSITKITYLVGLSSTSHLNKIFKETYGITPISYRKQSLKRI